MIPDFRGVFWSLFILGLIAGAILFVGLPWLWRVLRPWLHAVTG
jgi:hypothetical protein